MIIPGVVAAGRRLASGDPHWNNVELLLNMNGTDGSTTFTDSSLRARTVTAVGNAQISTTTPKFGTGCGLFDGTGDYLTVPHADVFRNVAAPFTFDVQSHVQTSHKAGLSFIVCKRELSGTTVGWAFYLQDGKPTFAIWNTSSGGVYAFVQGASATPVDQYNHIEVGFDGTTYRVFVDGTQVASTTSTTGTYSVSDAALYVGRQPSNTTRDYLGRLDDLRLTFGSTRHTSNFTPPVIEAGNN